MKYNELFVDFTNILDANEAISKLTTIFSKNFKIYPNFDNSRASSYLSVITDSVWNKKNNDKNDNLEDQLIRENKKWPHLLLNKRDKDLGIHF